MLKGSERTFITAVHTLIRSSLELSERDFMCDLSDYLYNIVLYCVGISSNYRHTSGA